MKKVAGLIILLFFVTACETTSTGGKKINTKLNLKSKLDLPSYKADYFKKTYFGKKDLDYIEGIWRWFDGNYTVAIIKNNTNQFKDYEYLGVVIKGRGVANRPGFVKLKLNKTASKNVYTGQYVVVNMALGFSMGGDEVTFLAKENYIETVVRQLGKVTLLRTYPSFEDRKSVSKERVERESSGSGFFVNNNGYIVTNNHVVDKCKKIQVAYENKKYDAKKYSFDLNNDISVLKTNINSNNFVKLKKNKNNLGQEILAFGFPLSDLLANNLNMTSGDISALSGIQNDIRYVQISAPVQPGNSGGPLIDRNGDLAGIVSAKINAIAVARYTGSLPENINFAIKTKNLIDHLEAHKIKFSYSDQKSNRNKSDIAKDAQKYTVKIICNN